MACGGCRRVYTRDAHGFWQLHTGTEATDIDFVYDIYVEIQQKNHARLFREYLLQQFGEGSFHTSLDIGCGIGGCVNEARDLGIEAYGADLPAQTVAWKARGNDPERFFACDATALPFAGDQFDAAWTLGVIEHIGTTNGYVLMDDVQEHRRRFAQEILRVVKPGGRIIVSCPNKRFPLDIQHPIDPEEAAKPTALYALRRKVFQRFNLNFHPVRGAYHLLSYKEVSDLFSPPGVRTTIRPLSMEGFFGFTLFQEGLRAKLLPVVKSYVEHLPPFLWKTWLNPYTLLMVTKEE